MLLDILNRLYHVHLCNRSQQNSLCYLLITKMRLQSNPIFVKFLCEL